MLTIRTSKFNTTIKKPPSALFLWFHNSKGRFVRQTFPYPLTEGLSVIRPLPRGLPATTAPSPMSTISPASIRLQKWMNQTSNATWAMTERNRQISAVFAEQRSRLRNFIRRSVPDPRDAEDILQDGFYKLVEANRLPAWITVRFLGAGLLAWRVSSQDSLVDI